MVKKDSGATALRTRPDRSSLAGERTQFLKQTMRKRGAKPKTIGVPGNAPQIEDDLICSIYFIDRIIRYGPQRGFPYPNQPPALIQIPHQLILSCSRSTRVRFIGRRQRLVDAVSRANNPKINRQGPPHRAHRLLPESSPARSYTSVIFTYYEKSPFVY